MGRRLPRTACKSRKIVDGNNVIPFWWLGFTVDSNGSNVARFGFRVDFDGSNVTPFWGVECWVDFDSSNVMLFLFWSYVCPQEVERSIPD